jgi:hypothetical protein
MDGKVKAFEILASNIITDLLTDRPHVVYFALGSATHDLNIGDDGLLKLEPKLNQQYPIFLQTLKEIYPDIPIIIVLIDKFLRSDPFMVKTIASNDATVDSDWRVTYETKIGDINYYRSYSNPKNRIIVHSIWDYVRFYGDDRISCDEFDITDMIISIMEYIISSRSVMVFNNYAGINMYELNRYFTTRYSGYLNRFMIGLGGDHSASCRPDLSDPLYQIQFYYSSDGITLFNPDAYSSTEIFREEYSRHSVGTPENKQLNYIFQNKLKRYINIVMSAMRMLDVMRKGNCDISIMTNFDRLIEKIICINEEHANCSGESKDDPIFVIGENKCSKEDLVESVFHAELHSVLRCMNKTDEYDGLIEVISSGKDTYKVYETFQERLKDIFVY